MPKTPITRIYGAIDYSPDLMFFQNMYRIAKEMSGNFKYWQTDHNTVAFSDTDSHESLIIGNSRTGFEIANPEDNYKAVMKLSQQVQLGLKTLSPNCINRMGIKIVKYVDLDLTFEQIRSQLRPLCLPRNEKLENATSSDILDIALHFDYKWNNYIGMLRVGPMKASQGRELLANSGRIMQIFANPNQNSTLSDLYASIPDSFLYLDLDMYFNKACKPDKWIPFVEEVAVHIDVVFDKLIAIVLECD